MSGSFAYDAGVNIESVVLLGVGAQRSGGPPHAQLTEGNWGASSGAPVYNATAGSLTYAVNIPLTGPMKMNLGWAN